MAKKIVKINKKGIVVILSIALIAVTLLPTLYSTIYLGSVWDVYNKLDSVPVAFVNMDKSFTKDGVEYSLGEDVANNLKDNNKVGWKFVSYDEAMAGVEGTEYYAVIEIPEDFSEKIANVKDGKFDTSEIIYIGNKGRNFVFSQVSSKVADSIKTEVSSAIQKEVSKSLVDNLYTVKNSLKSAGDGASKLQTGTQKLSDGSKDLASGTKVAADGSSQLTIGLNVAAASTVKLKDGTQKLLDGSTDLSNGITFAAGGSKQLIAGLKSLVTGENYVVSGSSSLVDGLNSLKSNLTKPNKQVPLLVKGASDLNTKTSAISDGASQLSSSVSALTNTITQTDSTLHNEITAIENSNLSDVDKAKIVGSIEALDKLSTSTSGSNESPLAKTASSMNQLSNNLQLLTTGSKQVSDGVSGLATGLSDTQTTAAAGLDKLIGGAQSIQDGSSRILTGLNTVTDKTGELSDGLDKLSTGSTSLQNGLRIVNDGNISLSNGLYTIDQKTGELSVGLYKLSSGANTLKDGLNSANSGTTSLSDGLNTGYETFNSNLKFSSDDMSQFISEPVTVEDDSINVVDHYGEGLAPYFMSMSLWIGAMVLSMVVVMAKSKKVFKSKFMNSYIGKFIAGSVISILQALILSFACIKGLGLNPASTPQFYLTNVFVAVVFFSVFYGVSNVIGMLASAVMFVVLLLQLSSSGGTFPIETAPAFYRVINKFVPMTYSVNTLRMTISGINQQVLNQNMVKLSIFIVSFLAGGYILKAMIDLIKNKIQKKQESKLEEDDEEAISDSQTA